MKNKKKQVFDLRKFFDEVFDNFNIIETTKLANDFYCQNQFVRELFKNKAILVLSLNSSN